MGFVDMHSHILPFMDDGAKNMSETLEMLRIAVQEGVTHIIVTPHYKSGRFPADAERIHDRIKEVQQEAEKENIPIILYAGNEIYYNSELEEKFEAGVHWLWLIALSGIVAGVIAFGISKFVITPQYESTTKVCGI